jgi:hypothetical protein
MASAAGWQPKDNRWAGMNPTDLSDTAASFNFCARDSFRYSRMLVSLPIRWSLPAEGPRGRIEMIYGMTDKSLDRKTNALQRALQGIAFFSHPSSPER